MPKTNKKPTVQILVNACTSGGAQQGFPQAGSLKGTNGFNIADGQSGIVSWDASSTSEPKGDFVATGNASVSAVNAIKVVQGTPVPNDYKKQSAWEVANKALVSSGILKDGKVRTVTESLPRSERASGEIVSGFTAPAIGDEYRFYVSLNSVRHDVSYGDNDDTVDIGAVASAATVANVVDQVVLKSLGLSENGNGTKDFVILGVDLDGAGTGTAIGTAVVGDQITYATDAKGQTYSLTLTQAHVYALAQLENDGVLVAASEIQNIVSGTESDCDAFIVLGLEQEIGAYDDDIYQVQPDVKLELADSFAADAGIVRTKVQPLEAFGKGRDWNIYNSNRAQLQVHTMQNHPHGEFFSEGANYIDADDNYSSIIIDYFDNEDVLSGGERLYEKTLIMLAPTTFTLVNVTTAATAIGGSNPPFASSVFGSCTGTGNEHN